MKLNQIINLKYFRGESDDATYIDQEVEDCGEEDCMDYETQNVSRTDFEKGPEEEDKLKWIFILIGVGLIFIFILICCCARLGPGDICFFCLLAQC